MFIIYSKLNAFIFIMSDDLFGWSNGSTDDVHIHITRFEWVRLLKYLKYKVQFIMMIFFAMLQSLFSRLNFLIQGKLATILVDSDYDTPNDFLDSINSISMQIIIVIIGEFVSIMISACFEAFYISKFEDDLKVEVMEQILNQDITYFDENETGVILSRISDDISNFWDGFTYTFMDFVYSICDFSIGIIICFFVSW